MSSRIYVSFGVAAQYKVNTATTLYYSQIGSCLDGFQLYGIQGAGGPLTASVDYEC
ncbi:hypothetical protein [Pseudomonas sp. PWP3-1b2]|uniref:hypothetical protein n=1 Tax=Pseudomonas TaxID=286 RepID=UPI003CE87A62